MKSNDRVMILVDDDVLVSPDFQRSRSPSIISTASSQTLRAESAEPEIVLSIERLSVEPSNANNGKRRCPSEFDDQSATSQRRPRLSAHAREGRVLINIEEEEDLRAREYDEKSDQIIDLEEIEQALGEEMFGLCEASRVQKSAGLAAGPRNGPVLVPFAEVGSYKWNGLSLRAGKTIELITGAFLKIKAVIQNLETDEVKIRGWKLMRARCLAGCLPKKINELAFIFEVDLDDPRSYLEQSVVEVGLNDVLRIRKLICTNHAFPKFRFNEDYVEGNSEKEMMNYIEHHEVLVARWKLTTKFGDVYNRIQNTKKPACSLFNQSQIESLLDEECTPGHAIAASIRRFAWRGRTILGGSGTKVKMKPEGRPDPSRKRAKVQDFISLLDDRYDEGSNKEKAKGHRNIQQGYTFCDTFSGGGGSVRGAFMAGLQLKFATDFNPICCETIRANFPYIKVYEKWAHEFAVTSGEFYVDVLHISPPCQVFSPVHTCPGKDDEMNFASLFAVGALIKKMKPRMVTLEQTFGILHDKFRLAFNQLIRMFTDAGYSTSWKLIKFQNFGLAQSRKRLIIVAAGPGETLPEFPDYTHSERAENNLKPWTSVREVLSKIPKNASQHDEQAAAAGGPRANWHRWDDSSIIKCITTNGGEYNCHPSGTRSLTYREFAALQGFPHEHFFAGNNAGVIKRQIGNAFPPIIAKIIFESIIKHLERADAAEKQKTRTDKGRC